MTAAGDFGLMAGALQLTVPSYAFRLIRRFGASRVGWFVVTAFSALALVHLLALLRPATADPASSTLFNIICVVSSILLLVGMGHIETLIAEREKIRSTAESLRTELEQQSKEDTAFLVRTNQEFVHELARREQIEKALAESEAQYRGLFADNPQPMWIIEAGSGRFLAVNRAALQQYGFTEREFMEMSAQDLLPAEMVAGYLEDLKQHRPKAESRGQWQHCRKDHSRIDVEVTTVDLTYAGIPARLVLANDVTFRHRLERQVRVSERMDTIAQVAGGAADSFGQLLTAIEHDTTLLLRRQHDPDSFELLNRVNAATNCAAALARQLQAVGGRHEVNPEPVDLNDMVRHLESVVRRFAGEQVAVRNVFGSGMLPALADRYLLEHIILNLVRNARDAMPGGGQLLISTTTTRAERPMEWGGAQAGSAEYVCLSFRDTGCGIDAATRAHLFEPFVSGQPGKSLGMGLAFVRGALKQLAGWAEVTSEPGAGTEVRIFLPCAPEQLSPSRLIKGTVMLVEPEDRIRELARSALNQHGYRVIEADSSEVALVLWGGQGREVDLLFTGIELPGEISGYDLANRLREVRPDLKVLFSCADESAEGGASADCAMIRKPFRPAVLVEKVTGVLSQNS